MDDCFLYRNPPFSFPYAGLFNPLRNFHDNQFAITGPDGDGPSKKHEESRKRKEKKRMSQILYSDNRRQRKIERLRAKLENRKNQDEKMEIKQENTVLSEEDLVTLFDSEDKPKKRKRKKRKNRKKKKKGDKKETQTEVGTEQTSKPNEQPVSNAGEAVLESVTSPAISNESLESVVSELSVVDDLSIEDEVKQTEAGEEETVLVKDPLLENADDLLVAGETSETKDEFHSLPEDNRKENEHLSCGESSTSSAERSTSEHDEKEAGETVSNDGETEEHNEEERSTISPEERGNLTEMILDDEFPWHLYNTEEDNAPNQSSFSPIDDAGFTVVRRKEKRPRKRKSSPPRKKKRRGQRRHRGRSDKKREKEKEVPPKKKSSTISPRTACPIRPVIPTPKLDRNPTGDPTLHSPTSPPPGFSPTSGNAVKSPTSVPTLTKPFEQMQSVNCMFMKMPHDSIITVPFMPLDTGADGPDIFPMNLDLSYPLDCTIPYYVIPNETPIEYVPPQQTECF